MGIVIVRDWNEVIVGAARWIASLTVGISRDAFWSAWSFQTSVTQTPFGSSASMATM